MKNVESNAWSISFIHKYWIYWFSLLILGLPKSGVSILRNSYFNSLGMCCENYSYISESWDNIPVHIANSPQPRRDHRPSCIFRTYRTKNIRLILQSSRLYFSSNIWRHSYAAITPCIFNLGSIWRVVVGIMLQSWYPRERVPSACLVGGGSELVQLWLQTKLLQFLSHYIATSNILKPLWCTQYMSS
jgi:hypothetical protein